MNSIQNKSIASLFSFLLILGFAHTAIASEITGTLSSDGSTGDQQQSVVSETQSQGTDATGQVLAQNGGSLQGSVTGGRDESAAMTAVANVSSLGAAAWLIPFAGVTLVALAYLLWSRKLT